METTKTVSSNTTSISSALQSEDTLPPRDDPQQASLDPFEFLEEGEAPRPLVDPKTDLTTLISPLIRNTDKLQKGMDKMGGWMQN